MTPQRGRPTPSRTSIDRTIDVIELSDDSDHALHSLPLTVGATGKGAPHGRSQRSLPPQRPHDELNLGYNSPSGYPSRRTQITPEVDALNSRAPKTPGYATPGTRRAKPVILDVIDISSDEEGRSSSPSPASSRLTRDLNIRKAAGPTGVASEPIKRTSPPSIDRYEARAVHEPDAEASDNSIECGCCFAERAFDTMIQCPDGHLFCRDCVLQYASTLLGAHKSIICCMDASECKLAFSESELRRVLTPKLMELYSRLVSQEAVAAAALDGLEECPFCDWKCIIEAPIETETLFRCGNREGGCGVVSCRKCKKKDHTPETCQEIKDDQTLNRRHAIEEAMTRALKRNCPNLACNKPFIKMSGCNHIHCPHCGTHSCYVCRKIISGGYGHFGWGKCPQNDNLQARHANEVRAAGLHAVAELKRADPNADPRALEALLQVPAPTGEQAILERRRRGLANLFQRQDALRREDLLRRRTEAPLDESEQWADEELAQQRVIARRAAQAQAAATPVKQRALSRVGNINATGSGNGSNSAMASPFARAYAHASDVLHSGQNRLPYSP